MKLGHVWWIAGLSLVGSASFLWISQRHAPAPPVAPDQAPTAQVPERPALYEPTQEVAMNPPSEPSAPAVAVGASSDETRAMTQIRDALRRAPERALRGIEAAERAHPRSPFSEERAALRVDALVYADQVGLARDAAEDFLVRYPDSARAEHIQMLTGVHPRPKDAP
jgi:hypothetical protein